jgi:Ice-binding-like/Bacterial Ig-like domain
MRMIKISSNTGVALLALAFTAGCGSTGTGAATDGGLGKDGASSPLSDARNVHDGNISADSGVSGDSGGLRDAESATDGGTLAAPTVLSNSPSAAATNVPVNTHISATFSEPMDPTTLTATTFALTTVTPAAPVPGMLVYASSEAVFWPTSPLAINTSFTATISTAAKSAEGVALGAIYTWTFATGSTATAGVPVDLGTAGQYVILAETGISTVSPSTVTGDLGVSPAAATYITGFPLTLDTSGVFATTAQVTGKVYAADYAVPTPIDLTTAIDDMDTAFTAAAGRAPDVTGLGAGSIGGMILPAGVYRWGTGLLMATDVTLTGSATDVWIFQVAKNLTVSNGAHLILAGGALSQNVFWQVSGNTTLGTTVQFEGTILCQTAIALKTSASITGRLLAQTATTLDANTVIVSP